MKPKPYKPLAVIAIDHALDALKGARALLVAAGAPKTAAKVRSAIKSAQGARNHAYLRQFRTETTGRP